MARLVISGPDGARELVLGDRLVVGRVEGVELVLDDKGISRRHCEFERRGDGYVVRDLGSSNGTLVNGEKIAADQPLAEGDRVRVGGVTLTFHARDADCVLRFTSGEQAGRDVPLAGARVTLGRRPDNTVAFVDVKVSGVHLEVAREGDGFVLRDLGSTNGTFLDGQKVTTEVALSHGDKVRLGANEFTFVDLKRGELPAEKAAGGAAAATRAALPAEKSKAGALLGLAGVVVAVGGAGAWYFMTTSRGGDAPTSGRAVAPMPTGTLLADDWSFEDPGTVDALWGAELGDGFAARRGASSSGSYALVADVADGHAVSSRRQKIALSGATPLRVSGQLAVADGALGSVALRFRSGDDAEFAAEWSVVAAQAVGGDFTPFEAAIVPPAWAKSVELVVVARGAGRVALDDLSLAAGSAPGGPLALGELELRPRGPAAWFVDHHAALAELFVPFGSGTVAAAEGAPTPSELPPGAFAARVTRSDAQFTLDPGSGPFAAAGFALEIAPELAARGVTLRGAQGTEQRFGTFAVEGVQELFFGAAAERFMVALQPAGKVVGSLRGDALRIELPCSAPLSLALAVDFATQRKEAGELFAKAQEEWRSGRAGSALLKLRELRERLPHDEKSVEQAKKLEAEIVPKLEADLSAVEAEAVGAEFLGSLDHYRRVLAKADALLAQTAGLEAAREFAKRAERMRGVAAGMERERREQEAARLLRLARAYQAQEAPAPLRPATAAELLEELQRSYADTLAAREARGEAVAPERSEGEGR